MFDKKKYQELVNERVNTDWEFKIDEICKELLFMITDNEVVFDEFIEYMKSEMTAEEYVYLSEISDEISQKSLHTNLWKRISFWQKNIQQKQKTIIYKVLLKLQKLGQKKPTRYCIENVIVKYF